MGIVIEEELKAIINDPSSSKVLATVDREGVPHVVFKSSVHVNQRGYLEYWELIETSKSQSNMVNSIWFSRKVAFNIRQGERSFEIIGRPERAIIAGREFEKAYNEARSRLGDVDLSTVWLVEPLAVKEETFEKRWKKEDEEHPILRHLDRVVVTERNGL